MSVVETSSTPISKPRGVSWVRMVFYMLLGIILPLVAGFFLSRKMVPTPPVGIIRLNTEIYSTSVDMLNQEIAKARSNPRIKAVVLQIDSPGGEVTATQTLFLELLKLRREMPVVGSIDSMAASGAFYAAMATDPIYAKPSSTVGNVGVWGYFPSEIGVNDVILASGPFKLTASNTAEFLRGIDSIKQEFIATVITQRGARLKISDVDLSQGLAYSGRETLEYGLIDNLGSQTEAIETAAHQAGIAHYAVIDLEMEVLKDILKDLNPLLTNPWIGKADPLTGKRQLPPGAYLLYDPRLGSTR